LQSSVATYDEVSLQKVPGKTGKMWSKLLFWGDSSAIKELRKIFICKHLRCESLGDRRASRSLREDSANKYWRLERIPQACPAVRSAFHYYAGPLASKSRRLVLRIVRLFTTSRPPSEKPNDPQDQPAGFERMEWPGF
jgi:hypothetical protein